MDGHAPILGRIYAYCPVRQAVTRVSRTEITASSDKAGYFLRGYLSGSEPDVPNDADGMLVDDQAAVDSWLRAVQVWRQTGEWTAADEPIRPGDIYEDCAFHPVLCTRAEGDEVEGISLIDASSLRSCDLRHCGVVKLSVADVLAARGDWQGYLSDRQAEVEAASRPGEESP